MADFSDLGGKQVSPAPQAAQSGAIDFSDLGGKVVKSAPAAIGAPANRAPAAATGQPTKPDISNQGQPPIPHGAAKTVGYGLAGMGQEAVDTAKGVASLIGSAYTPIAQAVAEPQKAFPAAYEKVKQAFTPSQQPSAPKTLPSPSEEMNVTGFEPSTGGAETSLPGQLLNIGENIPGISDITHGMEAASHAQPIPGQSLGTETETSGPEMARQVGRGTMRAALMKGPKLGSIGEATDAAAAARATVPPEIAGLSVPRTATQAGVTPGFETAETLLRGVPVVGSPLKTVGEAQAAFPEQVLTKLAGEAPIAGQPYSSSFNMAAVRAREAAEPMYSSLHELPMQPAVSDAAEKILQDRSLADILGGEAKQSLRRLTPEVPPEMGAYDDLSQAVMRKNYADLTPAEKQAFHARPDMVNMPPLEQTPVTFQEANQAQSDLKQYIADHSNPRTSSYDPDKVRRGWTAYHQLNDAVEASMTPQQLATKTAADRLWYQSYIKDNIGNSLFDELSGQATGKAQSPKAGAYNKMVAELDRKYVPGKESALEAAYPNAADRTAFKQLGQMLQTTQAVGGGTGSRFMLMGFMMGRVKLISPLMARGAATILANPQYARNAIVALKTGGQGAQGLAAVGALQDAMQRYEKQQQFQQVAPKPQESPVPEPIQQAIGGR